MRHSLTLASLAVASALLGCTDANSPAPPGSLRFDYVGSLPASSHGAFDVRGSLNPDSKNWQTGAIAQRGNDRIEVHGMSASPQQEFAFTLVGVTTTGPLTTCQERTTNCVYQGYFWPDIYSVHYFGWGLYDQPPYPELSVNVTELTGSRIKGTFAGQVIGYCHACNASVEDTVTITGGTFDVPFWK
jgi:hypothetical protein